MTHRQITQDMSSPHHVSESSIYERFPCKSASYSIICKDGRFIIMYATILRHRLLFFQPLSAHEMNSMNAIDNLFSLSENEERAEDDLLQAHTLTTVYNSLASTTPASTEQGEIPRNAPSQASPISSSLEQQEARPEKLALLQLAEWDRERTYDEEPSSCLHYTIE